MVGSPPLSRAKVLQEFGFLDEEDVGFSEAKHLVHACLPGRDIGRIDGAETSIPKPEAVELVMAMVFVAREGADA